LQSYVMTCLQRTNTTSAQLPAHCLAEIVHKCSYNEHNASHFGSGSDRTLNMIDGAASSQDQAANALCMRMGAKCRQKTKDIEVDLWRFCMSRAGTHLI
jgi:hypothetical protein